MVARGLVREAREELEVQQAKLKEVRDRLDRVSREDSQYLELATLEHRMLQVGALGGSPSLPPPGRQPVRELVGTLTGLVVRDSHGEKEPQPSRVLRGTAQGSVVREPECWG